MKDLPEYLTYFAGAIAVGLFIDILVRDYSDEPILIVTLPIIGALALISGLWSRLKK